LKKGGLLVETYRSREIRRAQVKGLKEKRAVGAGCRGLPGGVVEKKKRKGLIGGILLRPKVREREGWVKKNRGIP